MHTLQEHFSLSHSFITCLKAIIFSVHFMCSGSLFQMVGPREVKLFVPKVAVLTETFIKLFCCCFLTGRSLTSNWKISFTYEGFKLLIVLKISVQRVFNLYSLIKFLFELLKSSSYELSLSSCTYRRALLCIPSTLVSDFVDEKCHINGQ